MSKIRNLDLKSRLHFLNVKSFRTFQNYTQVSQRLKQNLDVYLVLSFSCRAFRNKQTNKKQTTPHPKQNQDTDQPFLLCLLFCVAFCFVGFIWLVGLVCFFVCACVSLHFCLLASVRTGEWEHGGGLGSDLQPMDAISFSGTSRLKINSDFFQLCPQTH